VKGQYKKSVLGRLWSLLNPLANIAVYSLVFGILVRAEPPLGTNSGLKSFALWVACGIIPWGFLATGTSIGRGALTDNAGLLTKVYFPRFVLPTSSIFALASTFVTELAALTLFMGIAGGSARVLFRLPVLIPVVLLNIAFVLGVSLVLSIAMVYFGDIQHIWGIFLQLWLYASGIVLPLSYVQQAQDKYHFPFVAIFQLNPGFQFVEAYRNVLYDFAVPPLQRWGIMLAWAVVALVIGALVFRRFSAQIVEEL
ncbi:MAG: ABC transporter permease, partial [Actinobacteria bacterium]|nr:ABC transporter permease [Actinomycetota bacterium]